MSQETHEKTDNENATWAWIKKLPQTFTVSFMVGFVAVISSFELFYPLEAFMIEAFENSFEENFLIVSGVVSILISAIGAAILIASRRSFNFLLRDGRSIELNDIQIRQKEIQTQMEITKKNLIESMDKMAVVDDAQIGVVTFDRQLVRIKDRLSDQIKKFEVRTTTNLLLGIVIALIGILILFSALGSSIENVPVDRIHDNNVFWNTVIAGALPKLSLAIAVELVAFFFLRLYKSGLAEINYLHSELSNIELRIGAAIVAFSSENEKDRSKVIQSLMDTERNIALAVGVMNKEVEFAKNDRKILSKAMEVVGRQ